MPKARTTRTSLEYVGILANGTPTRAYLFDLDEFHRDLATHEALSARIVRLTQLLEQMRNTEMALDRDAMVAALDAYSFSRTARQER